MKRNRSLREAPPPENDSIAARIREERIRLGLSFEEFSARVGRSRTTQQFYEANISDANAEYFLSASDVGADVRFIITGARSVGKYKLTRQEMELIEGYRASDKSVRAFALGGMSSIIFLSTLLAEEGGAIPAGNINSFDGLTTPERLREERERLGINQTEFSILVGLKRTRIVALENGKLAPKGAELKVFDSHGINITYVVCGYCLADLSGDEEILLSYYRKIPETVRRSVCAALVT